jgi:Fe-S oxidoreductase
MRVGCALLTTTYDPHHPQYLDEADVRDELTRVYDVCQGCRRCTELCGAFPTLFELIDAHDDHDAGRLTPFEQDLVVEQCFQCKLCALDCPYAPELHERNVDFPRLMLRAEAMRHDSHLTSPRDRTTTRVLAHADLIGTLATAVAPIVNRAIATPESAVRKVIAKVTGVSAKRLLPPYATERFSTWSKNRQRVTTGDRQGRVTLFPTCLVEYREPAIGKDLVKVYERNGIDCETSGARCCGAPWLYAGNVDKFTKVAERNVAILADEVRGGTDVVVAQPTCGYVVRKDYADHVGGADAQLVADHTYDPAEYLMKVHRGDDIGLDIEFNGETVGQITYHVPCHLRALDIGYGSRDLMKLTGADVTLVRQCSGMDGTWGLRARNDEYSIPLAARLGAEIDRVGGEVVAGDCHRANTVITEQTGREPRHPMQLIARAYGIPVEQ